MLVPEDRFAIAEFLNAHTNGAVLELSKELYLINATSDREQTEEDRQIKQDSLIKLGNYFDPLEPGIKNKKNVKTAKYFYEKAAKWEAPWE